MINLNKLPKVSKKNSSYLKEVLSGYNSLSDFLRDEDPSYIELEFLLVYELKSKKRLRILERINNFYYKRKAEELYGEIIEEIREQS